MFDLIGFDADDTLWHNENLYLMGRERFLALLEPYAPAELAGARMDAIVIANLGTFGFGVMSYALSLIEAAIDLTGGRITGQEISALLDLAKEMMAAEVQLFEGAQETVADLSKRYPLTLITKGDLRHQEAKVMRSGLKEYFRSIDVVSDKTPEMYAAILARHGVEPGRFLMVGNSPKSDILPVLELGGWAIYVPHDLTWSHEHLDGPAGHNERYLEVEHLSLVPGIIARLARGG